MMRAAGTVFWVTLATVVLLATGCRGERGHRFKETTAFIGGDGETNRVVTVDFESHLDLWNTKLDLEKVKLHEGFGKDGWVYDVGFDSANSRPDNAFAQMLIQGLLQGAGRPANIGNPDEADRLSRLEERLSALADRLEADPEPEPDPGNG